MFESPDYDYPDDVYEMQDDPLRQHAMQLYEHCLTDNRPEYLEMLLEQLLAQTPPPLDTLYDIASDLQNRLMTLREYHFATREKVIRALNNIYHADVTHLAPADQLHTYHQLNPDTLIACVRRQGFMLHDEERTILAEMIKASLQTCGQLFDDIQLTEMLLTSLIDWLHAHIVTHARQHQSFPPTDSQTNWLQ